ncbi:MAG: YjbH domain-containing protein, partial [Woeseiaceae bacterium]|nr:YjbH domain-containing protein [Woeseiaceae bacterium]
MFKKDFFILFFSLSYSLVVPGILYADLSDYIYPNTSPSYSNYGTPGLIQMPSARFQSEGTLGINWSNADPYLRGTILAYPFSWFEASYSYIDINNAFYSNAIAFSGDQTYKDKGFDVKF